MNFFLKNIFPLVFVLIFEDKIKIFFNEMLTLLKRRKQESFILTLYFVKIAITDFERYFRLSFSLKQH